SGGGFLFFDREKEEYAGGLQLDFGRLALTAIGLLTTRLPEGGQGYSVLIVFTLELPPPLQLGPLSPPAIGGISRLPPPLGADAAVRRPPPHRPAGRAALHTRPPASPLSLQGPVAKPGPFLGALRRVFPPRRDASVAGPGVRLGGARPAFLTAEIALVFEWGA